MDRRETILIWGLLLLVWPGRAYGGPLEVDVATDKGTYHMDERIVVSVRIRNVSGRPVVLPQLGPDNQLTYLSLDVVHESGAPVFFISGLGERPRAVAETTQTLQDREELVLTEVLNETGVGFLGYTDPSSAKSLRLFSGKFEVTATYHTEAERGGFYVTGDTELHTEPLRSTPATFEVSSTDEVQPVHESLDQ